MQSALSGLVITFAAAVSALFGYWRLRRFFQDRIDMNHVTFQLTYPFELDKATSTRMIAGLRGVTRHPGRYGDPWGKPTVVLEVLGTAQGLYHLISFPKE